MELKNYFSLFDDSFKLFEFLSRHLLCDVPSDSILVDKVHFVVDSYRDLLHHLKS